MTQHLAIIDLSRLDRIEARIDALVRMVEKSHIQPAPEWVSVADYARMNKRSTETVRRWIREGRVDTKMDGNIRKVRV